MGTDSVTLEAAAGGTKADTAAGKKNSDCLGVLNIKILISLFLIFVVVQSELFTNSVLSGFRGAVNCRAPTSYGVAVQGTFLVLFFILAVYLFEGRIL